LEIKIGLYTFASMTALQDFKTKHTDIKDKINSLAQQKFGNGWMLYACQLIAKNLASSRQTVYNYITGTIKDGYLADAIYKELKRLTIKELEEYKASLKN
jgi:hypothetical protein